MRLWHRHYYICFSSAAKIRLVPPRVPFHYPQLLPRAVPVFRWQVLKITVAVAMLCGLMLSPRLWLTARTYPHTPVWYELPQLPTPLDWLLLGVLAAALGAIIVSPRPRPALLIFVGIAAIWSLWDQTRWQPWFYQYLFMFAVLAFSPAPNDEDRAQAGLNACRFIVASLYVWSGLQKVNHNFAEVTYPWLMKPVLNHLPDSKLWLVSGHGWQVGFVECAIGLSLLVWPLRPLAVVGALLMHSVILFCLGPWGHAWNTIVWPWNLAMMVFVVVLFARTRPVKPWQILWPRRCLLAPVTLLLLGIMPLFNFFELWDSYLSAALYSSNTPEAEFHISQEVYDRLPEEARVHAQWREVEPEDPDADCPYEMDIVSWSMAEMNVPPNPEPRVFRGIARRLADFPRSKASDRNSADPSSSVRVILIVKGRTDWRTGKAKETREEFRGP
jgi:hypothetical protein